MRSHHLSIPMKPAVKKTVAITAAAFLVAIAVYGSYLPYRKSHTYIMALGSLKSARDLQSFTDLLAEPLDAASPIGQEELVRNTGNSFLDIVSVNAARRPDIADALINFLNSYYDPILRYGRGMSYTQNLYLLGALNEIAYSQTRDPKYFIASKKYYEEGLVLSPTRPQFLYGLFDIYRTEKNIPKVKQVTDQILAQWPDDERTRAAYAEYMKTYGGGK